jgi:hypothetical protein
MHCPSSQVSAGWVVSVAKLGGPVIAWALWAKGSPGAPPKPVLPASILISTSPRHRTAVLIASSIGSTVLSSKPRTLVR